MTADDLRALSVAATPGPWRAYKYGVIGSGDLRNGDVCGDYQDDMRWDDKALIVWLRNHADAIADLIDAAREVRDDMAAGALDYHVQAANRLSGVRLHEALTALDGTP